MGKIKQVKLIEGETLQEAEQILNGFYMECETNDLDVISTKFLSKNPYIIQVVYLKEIK